MLHGFLAHASSNYHLPRKSGLLLSSFATSSRKACAQVGKEHTNHETMMEIKQIAAGQGQLLPSPAPLVSEGKQQFTYACRTDLN